MFELIAYSLPCEFCIGKYIMYSLAGFGAMATGFIGTRILHRKQKTIEDPHKVKAVLQ